MANHRRSPRRKHSQPQGSNDETNGNASGQSSESAMHDGARSRTVLNTCLLGASHVTVPPENVALPSKHLQPVPA